jgi:protein-S-isoprenylcysteine O-methyltransferase Ste14
MGSQMKRGLMKRPRRLLPPTIAVLSLFTMMALHVVLPIATVVQAPFSYGGALLVAAGAAMIVWSRRAFQTAGTPIKPFSESAALIRHGFYRWTRNPMYVGAVLLLTGVAILLGSLAPLLVVIAFFTLLQVGFVRREERLLEETFGDAYRAYRRSVRRWL